MYSHKEIRWSLCWRQKLSQSAQNSWTWDRSRKHNPVRNWKDNSKQI